MRGSKLLSWCPIACETGPRGCFFEQFERWIVLWPHQSLGRGFVAASESGVRCILGPATASLWFEYSRSDSERKILIGQFSAWNVLGMCQNVWWIPDEVQRLHTCARENLFWQLDQPWEHFRCVSDWSVLWQVVKINSGAEFTCIRADCRPLYSPLQTLCNPLLPATRGQLSAANGRYTRACFAG